MHARYSSFHHARGVEKPSRIAGAKESFRFSPPQLERSLVSPRPSTTALEGFFFSETLAVLAITALTFALLAEIFDTHVALLAIEASGLPEGRHDRLEGCLGSRRRFLGTRHSG